MKNMNNTSHLKKYINKHLQDPFFIAAQEKIEHGYITNDVETKVLHKIFSDVDAKKINLDFQLVTDLSPSKSFFGIYQLKFEELDNKIVSYSAYTNSLSKKEKFNVYENYGMRLEKDSFYEHLNNNSATVAFTYKRFIQKVRQAIFDKSSLPFPFYLEKNEQIAVALAENINLNLFKGMKSIFKFSKTSVRDIILDAFTDDIRKILSINPKQLDVYQKKFVDYIYEIHPNHFEYLNKQHNIIIPREHKIQYVLQNAEKMNLEQFKYFASAFKSHHLDDDVIANFVEQEYARQNKQNKNVEQNLALFINYDEYMKDNQELYIAGVKNNENKTSNQSINSNKSFDYLSI